MASIHNRSSWIVQIKGQKQKKFRSETAARAHVESFGHDLQKLPKNTISRPDSAFEVQITLKDKKGVEITRSQTLSTEKEAIDWADKETRALKALITNQGGFSVGYETITIEEALKKLLEEHYKTKASYNEISYRVPYLTEWIGPKKRFRDLTRDDMVNLLSKLESEGYSGSSIRNYITIMTTLYKKAKSKWNYPVVNVASGLDLPEVNNAVERYWKGDEKVRLMKSLAQRSPWLIPIVELSLEMAFRRGELVQAPVRVVRDTTAPEVPLKTKAGKDKKNTPASGEMTGGMKWEDIDWTSFPNRLKLPKEKNDHTKKPTESKGRTVPITPKMKEILWPLYEASPTKSGLIFSATINSVSNSFRNACKKAEPPIKGLTFHSLRKIATKDLSMRVTNPKALGKLSGHKNMQVLFERYFEVTFDQLADMLTTASGSVQKRGIAVLTGTLGLQHAKQFLQEIRELKDLDEAFA